MIWGMFVRDLIEKLCTWCGGKVDVELAAAYQKRAMERALRAQGHSRGYAKAMVAERFRRLGMRV
jgi:hypothetical protein